MNVAAKRVAKNTSILYIRMGITVFISLYSTRLTLAALGIADFGIFNVIAGAIAMLTFLNSAMASTTQRFLSYAEGMGDLGKSKSIFNVSVVLHLIISFLVFVLLQIAGFFLFDGVLVIPEDRITQAQWVYQFMIISTVFMIISVPDDAILNAHENMLAFAVISIIEALLKLGVALFISYNLTYDKLIAFGFLTACSAVFILLLRRIYCHMRYNESHINIRNYFDWQIFREMGSFGGWSFLASSSSIIASYGQGIILNMFFGSIVNSAQGIALQVNGQISVFAGTMMKAVNPLITKSEGGGDRNLMISSTMTGSKVAFFLLLVFACPVIIEMHFIFDVWLEVVPAYTIIFCRLLIIRSLLEQMYLTLNTAIIAVGNIKFYQIITSFFGITPLVASYILFIFGFPPYYVYITTLFYVVIRFLTMLYFAQKNIGISPWFYIRNIVLRCLSCAICVFAIALISYWFLLNVPDFFRLFVIVLVSAITSTLGFLFIILRKTERDEILTFLLKRTVFKKYYI